MKLYFSPTIVTIYFSFTQFSKYFSFLFLDKPDSTSIVEETNVEEVKKYMNKGKLSNTVGLERISSQIINFGASIFSVLLTHAINIRICQSNFSEVIKIVRVTPILKPDQIKTDKTGKGGTIPPLLRNVIFTWLFLLAWGILIP